MCRSASHHMFLCLFEQTGITFGKYGLINYEQHLQDGNKEFVALLLFLHWRLEKLDQRKLVSPPPPTPPSSIEKPPIIAHPHPPHPPKRCHNRLLVPGKSHLMSSHMPDPVPFGAEKAGSITQQEQQVMVDAR